MRRGKGVRGSRRMEEMGYGLVVASSLCQCDWGWRSRFTRDSEITSFAILPLYLQMTDLLAGQKYLCLSPNIQTRISHAAE